MQKAQRHLTKLLGNKISAKMKVSTLGGGSPNRNTQVLNQSCLGEDSDWPINSSRTSRQGWTPRKSPLTSPSGTLTRLVNAVITPGGEIAKRRAFVMVAPVTGSPSVWRRRRSTLFVFGRNVAPAEPAIGVPGVTLKGLNVPNACR